MGKQIFKKLPVEIIEEILLKLPIKSLLRFKCVSKSWRSSLSSRGFIKAHLNKLNSGTDLAHHNLIFAFSHSQRISHELDSPPIARLGSFSFRSLLDEYDDEPISPSLRSNLSIPIPYLEDVNPIRDSVTCINLWGSCNGLILIHINYGELYLWNPSTRKAKYIQNPCSWQICSGYGFGYDESTDDYKVVTNFSCLEPPFQTQMYMYSSRGDSWKKTQNFTKGSLLNCPAKFVNRRLYWLTNKGTYIFPSTWYIVSFDLVEEEYQIVALPYSIRYYDYYHRTVLQDLGGYLSLICYDEAIDIMDVWVMKEESWSKIWTFSYMDIISGDPMPLWLKKNEDIVVAIESNAVIYHGNDKLRQSPLNMFNARTNYVVYVESLVSPIGDDGQL